MSIERTKKYITLTAELNAIAKSNPCVSKNGSKISQQFTSLNTRKPGQLSVLDHHRETQEHHLDINKVKEENLKEEGRMKIIRSDLKRARIDNSVKDLRIMLQQQREHSLKVRKDYSKLQDENPTQAQKFKLERALPKQEDTVFSKSQSRAQRELYDMKDDLLKPKSTLYRPKYVRVEKLEARPTSMRQIEENPGLAKKRENFEKMQMRIVHKIAEKLDRGHSVSELKQQYIDRILDDPQRRQSSVDNLSQRGGYASVLNRKQSKSPSIKALSRN